jgi:hypothetical protein
MISNEQKNFKKKYSVIALGLRYLDKSVLIRSVVLALIIGSMLTLGNQNSAVFGANNFIKMQLILTFITPFVVITLSQIYGMHQANIDKTNSKVLSVSEQFRTTLLTHNIIIRALIISLLVGSVNSAIVLTTTLDQFVVENTPWFLLFQFYVLPLFFGAFSQALAYRRSITK